MIEVQKFAYKIVTIKYCYYSSVKSENLKANFDLVFKVLICSFILETPWTKYIKVKSKNYKKI